MKTHSTTQYNQQAFAALRPDKSISEKVFKSISEAPAVKNFSQKYDANVGITMLMSSKKPTTSNMALELYDIKPITVLEKVKNLFRKHPTKEIVLKTHANTDEAFISSIQNKNEKSLLELC